MLRQETDFGNITVGLNVYTQIAGNAATKCFGVKGMAMRLQLQTIANFS